GGGRESRDDPPRGQACRHPASPPTHRGSRLPTGPARARQPLRWLSPRPRLRGSSRPRHGESHVRSASALAYNLPGRRIAQRTEREVTVTMSKHPSLFATLGILIGYAASAAGQSGSLGYPQWRGQNRDGSASALPVPKSWPDKLTLKWKVDVGEGYATPIVIGPRVFTHTRRDVNEVMTALDAATGKVLWQTDYAAPYKMN